MVTLTNTHTKQCLPLHKEINHNQLEIRPIRTSQQAEHEEPHSPVDMTHNWPLTMMYDSPKQQIFPKKHDTGRIALCALYQPYPTSLP